ncbi:DNA photolyase [Strigomonas culicis]|uniref:DNA photolyase n=1 Tax=Strigomonas culicis TaxID=28005 RepID=S9U9F0_9TRYP|nr:DNA photolyase [Strigomonas culicis]|eukprot:EPY25543.1 DNA photolyase [Strigomonas culicis]
MTTQYAPHERRVQEAAVAALRAGAWVHRETVQLRLAGAAAPDDVGGEVLAQVIAHDADGGAATPPAVHTVWQTTLLHLDDLPTPVAAMKEGERWYHDDVTVAPVRPTAPYDAAIARAVDLPRWTALLPSVAEAAGRAPTPVVRGTLPTLAQLGYGDIVPCFQFTEVIATESSHPAGEVAALARVDEWLAQGGATSLLRYGRPRRTNTKLYSHKLSRLSPYLSTGSLSPRALYERLRDYAAAHARDGFAQMQYREALLRLSRRDYWHWMGLRYGDRLFFRYGPHPEETDGIADYRHDVKIVQRWAAALTGIPFADAAMRELTGTGFVADAGRQALAWLLTRGYGQDWRLAAEWFERCSLDYDPFVCYGLTAYCGELLHDDFGEPVRNVHYLAHQHDQTGIYIKRWLPQLSRVPPVYIHRPHVLTPRMQAMHTVRLGHHYPYPVKLWDGAQDTLGSQQLRAYFPGAPQRWRGPGCGEALRHGRAVLQPEELSAAVAPAAVARQGWARAYLPAATLDALALAEGDDGDEAELELLLRQFATQKSQPRAAAAQVAAGAAGEAHK